MAPSSSAGTAHDSLTVGLLEAGIRHHPAVAEIPEPEPLFPFPLPFPHPLPCRKMEGFSLDRAGQSFKERGRQIPNFKTLQGGTEPRPSPGRILEPESQKGCNLLISQI